MNKISTYDPAIKFKPDYVWPEEGAERNCPKCETAMQLVDNDPTYFGKPWWCPQCKWQFSEEDLTDQA